MLDVSLISTIQKQSIYRGGRFRQTGISGGNIIVGTVLGIISGKYIFEEPLQHYWAQKRAEEAQQAGGVASSSSSSSTPIIDTNMGDSRKA